MGCEQGTVLGDWCENAGWLNREHVRRLLVLKWNGIVIIAIMEETQSVQAEYVILLLCLICFGILV